jgi:integrase
LNRLYTLTGAQGVPLGEMPINAIGEPDIEAALRSLGDDVSASTWNKYVQLCQSLSKWGLKKKYLTHSWFTDDPDIRRADEGPSERHRRLEPDQVTEAGVTVQGDERRLLAAAPPRLQRLIIAALETCCRADELLQLQWRHVGPDWLQLPGANTKAGAVREIPISTRLRAVLEMARLDPAGKQFPADAHVFGNEVGEAAPFPRKAWETTVLKAHGHRPVWEPGKGRLTETCRAQLAAIDLTFHDLRHEAGSRLLEAGWPLHHVRDMLGHADISTTSRYLNAARFGLRESMRRAESAAVPGSNSGEQTVTLAKTLQKTESETPDPDPIDEGEKRRKVLIQ